jgi:glycosyltransferase involved in cell wall biosynthesis
VIAGTGVDRDLLEARARGLGVLDAVRFLGFTEDSATVLRGADLFVSASWAESFPYVILEAMALGVPVVATRVGGVGEAVSDGLTGLLVPPRDAASLARAIGSLISDRERADDMGARAVSDVRSRFTREQMLEGVATVYREVLA